MSYPECKTGNNDCRFVSDNSVTRTCMYSPIERDRNGNPIGGGRNITTRQLNCMACGGRWTKQYTDMQCELGQIPGWEAAT